MHRMKIGLVAAIILLALTGGLYSVVTKELKDTVVQEVETEVSRGQRMHQSIARLEALDFANLVAGLSHRAAIVGVFEKEDDMGRRQAAFEQCEDVNAFLQKGGARKADFVIIVDSAGKVVARDLNVNAMYGEDLRSKYPAVALALRGEATKDIWTFGQGNGRMTRVAAAPIIHPDGSTKGALLVGYVVDARDAQLKREVLGVEVGYFHDGKMATSSFISGGAGESAKEDGNKTQALNTVLFQGAEKWGNDAVTKGKPTELFHLSLDGREYAAIAAPLQGNAFSKTSGVVVLKSVSDILEPVGDVGIKILGFGILAIVVALGASVMTSLRFIKPLDKIELGVAEIINGNIDYMFKPVGQDFEGLSNALNVMLARLLGREEVSDEEGEDEADEANKWKSEQMLVEEASAAAAAGGDPEAQALGQEAEPIYFARIFNEYSTALKSQGKPTKGITVQAFTAKLRLIEGGLKQKWKCRMVRFKVNAHGDQVTLKPVPIF